MWRGSVIIASASAVAGVALLALYRRRSGPYIHNDASPVAVPITPKKPTAMADPRRFTTKSPGWERPSVTVFYNASPGWSKDVGDKLTEILQKSDAVFMRHWGDYFENGTGFLASLTDILPSLDATVIVLGPDDPRTIDGPSGPSAEPRRNVIVELGASIASIGADHTVLVTQDGNVALPSYLAGIKHKRLGARPSDDDLLRVARLVEERALERKTVLPRPADALFVGYKLNYLNHVVNGMSAAANGRTLTIILPYVDHHMWDASDVANFSRRLEQRNAWAEVVYKPPSASRALSVRSTSDSLPASHTNPTAELPTAMYDFPTTLSVVFELARDRFIHRPLPYELFVHREIAAFAAAVRAYSEGYDGGHTVRVCFARKDGTLMPHPSASL